MVNDCSFAATAKVLGVRDEGQVFPNLNVPNRVDEEKRLSNSHSDVSCSLACAPCCTPLPHPAQYPHKTRPTHFSDIKTLHSISELPSRVHYILCHQRVGAVSEFWGCEKVQGGGGKG